MAKFKREFKKMGMQHNYGIKAKPTTSHNTADHKQIQSLSEYKKLSTVNDMLRSFDLENNHENIEEQEDNLFDYFLQSTTWAIRSTYHKTLQTIPCHLVFGRDMIRNIAFRVN
jgi:hypothetical protein